MTHRFYKDNTGWYIDLPNWPLAKSHLAMVSGADTLLDSLSNHGQEVRLRIATKSFEGYDEHIVRTKKLGLAHGADYEGGSPGLIENSRNKLWLCPVTLWVFGSYPKEIYFKILSRR